MYTIFLGLLLVGEAAVLLVGTRLINKGKNPWNTHKNSIFLFLDILCGTILLLSVLHKFPEVIFWIVFILVVLSHAFREFEYLSLQEQPFCSNLPLFMVNNVKIVLSMSTAVIHLTFI